MYISVWLIKVYTMSHMSRVHVIHLTLQLALHGAVVVTREDEDEDVDLGSTAGDENRGRAASLATVSS